MWSTITRVGARPPTGTQAPTTMHSSQQPWLPGCRETPGGRSTRLFFGASLLQNILAFAELARKIRPLGLAFGQ
jgi:hypothetical protein